MEKFDISKANLLNLNSPARSTTQVSLTPTQTQQYKRRDHVGPLDLVQMAPILSLVLAERAFDWFFD